MLKNSIFSILTVATLFFAGCSTLSTEKSDKPDVSFTNTYFKAITLLGNKAEVFDIEAHIIFNKKGTLRGNLGCNGFFGSFKTKDDNIIFENIGSTKMMCPHMKTEDAFIEVLQNTKRYEIEGETLTFYNANEEKISQFQAIFF